MEEIWKPVVGFEGRYEVSNLGNVRSLDTFVVYSNGRSRVHKGRVLKFDYKHGYRYVTLIGTEKKLNCKRVHRLVAEAFIPNLNNLPEVNHIDFNRANNRVENLEWCNRAENVLHSFNAGRNNGVYAAGKKNKKPIVCETDGKVFNSMREAAKYYKLFESGISSSCRNGCKCGGFKFSYIEGVPNGSSSRNC